MTPDRDPLRAAAQYRVDRLAERDGVPPGGAASAGAVPAPAGPPRPAPAPGAPPRAAGRTERRGTWVDEVVRQAVARGEFDHLALAGRPIPGITRHDPDWWLKALIEREHLTGLAPEAFRLRRDDAALDERLDAERTEAGVRALVGEFNARVVAARRQLLGGPPVVTPTRDVEAEVTRWRERRAAAGQAAAPQAPEAQAARASSPRPAPHGRGHRVRRRRALRSDGTPGT